MVASLHCVVFENLSTSLVEQVRTRVAAHEEVRARAFVEEHAHAGAVDGAVSEHLGGGLLHPA